jgi:hypothetical protein
MEEDVFWTYNQTSVTVKTANHGELPASGRGNCVADFTINGQTRRICLSDCLHAPGAFINLVSVARMLKKGWECNFKPHPPRCELIRQEKTLGVIPMTGHLFLLDLKFIRPDQANPLSISPPEISVKTHTGGSH